jgi:hypothetical protein
LAAGYQLLARAPGIVAVLLVLLSHSCRDKPAVESLARFLRQRGIDAWFDQGEISPGDDIIARMNAGLEQADAGLFISSI